MLRPGRSVGLADFLLDDFFYPSGRMEKAVITAADLPDESGETHWRRSSVGFNGILLQTQHRQTHLQGHKKGSTPLRTEITLGVWVIC